VGAVADPGQDVDIGGALIASSSALSVARSSQRSSIIPWRSSALSASLRLRQQIQRHSQPSLVLISDQRHAQEGRVKTMACTGPGAMAWSGPHLASVVVGVDVA
jgi:hypothetical protein